MLGSVIEKVTGKSYYQNVRERIVNPLQIKTTYLEDLDMYRDRRATGYYKFPFGDLHTNDQFMDVANADGGFLSTVFDIMTFYRSYYYADVLLSESAKENDPEFEFLRSLPPGRAPMAAGGYEGFNTALYQVFQNDVSIVVFSNMDEPAGEILAGGILALTRGQEPLQPSLPAKMAVVQAFQKNRADYVQSHFEKLTENYHPMDPKEWILNDLGYAYMYEKKDVDSAIEMFQLNTLLFPDNANSWDSFGEAWLQKGDKVKALECYKKALAIDPELPSAKKAIEKMK
jgi:tetratricopeptide (TPR) repeat protein